MRRLTRFISFLSLLLLFGLAAAVLTVRVPAAPQDAGPAAIVRIAPPVVDQVLSAALWRIDAGFQSTIQIYNRHIIQHRLIMPVLYMSDGTEYDLPIQDVAPNSMATINVGDALANAPPALQGHISLYGSVVLHFPAPTVGSIGAAMRILDPVNSLSFIYPFHALDSMSTTSQTLDGLWWRRDAGVSGFVGLANGTANSIQVSLQALGAAGAAGQPQAIRLLGHTTQLLPLSQLIAALPASQTLMGGLHIAFTGKMSDVMIVGGLENQAEGYSALIPFYPHDSQMNMTSSTAPVTIGSSGIMVGRPDPRMGFPNGTVFFPYTYLRNASSSTMTVQRGLYYTLTQGSGQQVSLPTVTIPAGNTVQLPLDFGSIGLGGYGGDITETFSTTAEVANLIIATGSTDQTANYVFEVLPQPAITTKSKQDLFWAVGSGWDTMTTFWNSGTAAEDLLVSISFQGGASTYKLPIHLQAGGSESIDLLDLIHHGLPDSDGHVIPSTVQGGGMIISGPGDFMDDINVVISGGVFSVFGATCYPMCYSCGPQLEQYYLAPAPFNSAVGGTQQMTATLEYTTGTKVNETSRTSWSSKNTAVATVVSGGMASAVAVGSTEIDGLISWSYEPETCYPAPCRSANFVAPARVNVMPVISSISPALGPVTMTVFGVTINGSGFGTSPTVNPGSGITVDMVSVSNTQIQVNLVIASNATPGNHAVTVTAGGQTSNSTNFFVQVPTSVAVLKTVSQGTNNCGSGYSGWVRVVTLQLQDQRTPAQPILFSGFTVADAIQGGSPNGCALSAYRTGVSNTDSNGSWQDTYNICSTFCANGGNCQTNATQTWTANGITLARPVAIGYKCNSITLNGN